MMPGETASAIVTGAGSGIGRAIAIRLAADGYAVLVNDLDLGRAQAVVSEIAVSGAKAVAAAGDVSSEVDARAIHAAAVAAFGDTDLLINNAGIVHQSLFENLEIADFDRMFAVHVRGTFLMTKMVLPAMLKAGKGAVINVASQLGQVGGIELSHYAAAKSAIIGMTKSLAREVSSRGVRVNAVAPGPINTPLVRELSQEWRTRKASELPLGRFGEPEEVAATVAFLASPQASLFVGQTLGPNSGDVML
ncbi:glucose 1-dehydrogenase [Mesorhizobium loti]|jgi:3-oxoacyl-[acyl-carrier protein] reductase|uniref:Glucose 1-dehydrogenase n=1 Tax=Mesorhizobium jarvisii TaxID=1777867 RepID=A0A6M7TFY3_9HYPH|nr:MULTISPECIES: glucose 1-dehydrogenase [Mesorhizobium]QKC63226.1 glucose 1-dehydrogenase [Mesorhizobium jarvisii]QKD09136.1 glucose 1-dehydrogenase [Mesorhizobium loti]RJT30232.1 glucose 1-dehydrogenase [Mesorhizobium jarvisii]BCH03984.1 3-oxoacyl-ACP reductase [Mesorhizobium sp. 131-2-5]BCH11747.1 3-oxoacyl-ACP reductase [Mesorhizobium sp. 131-3-5]